MIGKMIKIIAVTLTMAIVLTGIGVSGFAVETSANTVLSTENATVAFTETKQDDGSNEIGFTVTPKEETLLIVEKVSVAPSFEQLGNTGVYTQSASEAGNQVAFTIGYEGGITEELVYTPAAAPETVEPEAKKVLKKTNVETIDDYNVEKVYDGKEVNLPTKDELIEFVEGKINVGGVEGVELKKSSLSYENKPKNAPTNVKWVDGQKPEGTFSDSDVAARTYTYEVKDTEGNSYTGEVFIKIYPRLVRYWVDSNSVAIVEGSNLKVEKGSFEGIDGNNYGYEMSQVAGDFTTAVKGKELRAWYSDINNNPLVKQGQPIIGESFEEIVGTDPKTYASSDIPLRLDTDEKKFKLDSEDAIPLTINEKYFDDNHFVSNANSKNLQIISGLEYNASTKVVDGSGITLEADDVLEENKEVLKNISKNLPDGYEYEVRFLGNKGKFNATSWTSPAEEGVHEVQYKILAIDTDTGKIADVEKQAKKNKLQGFTLTVEIEEVNTNTGGDDTTGGTDEATPAPIPAPAAALVTIVADFVPTAAVPAELETVEEDQVPLASGTENQEEQGSTFNLLLIMLVAIALLGTAIMLFMKKRNREEA